jgi:hypothetical protein
VNAHTSLHGPTTQKTAIFIVTAVRTLSPTYLKITRPTSFCAVKVRKYLDKKRVLYLPEIKTEQYKNISSDSSDPITGAKI